MMPGESSSSNSNSNASLQRKHHVFLSSATESGPDFDFCDNLRSSLERKGITTFRHDNPVQIREAIQESVVAIVILSENYASSARCLNELQMILLLGTDVLPVFYDVTPSDVRYQKNSFAKAFEIHANTYVDDKDRVQKWRDSLNQVAHFSGWDSKYIGKEQLIEDIIESVWRKLRSKLPSFHNDGLVGIDSRVGKVVSLLRLELKEEVRFVGIWGMGGSGKTTLARAVFNKICDQFDISCFLEDVRVISEESDGKLRLQETLLSRLKVKGLEIKNLDHGKSIIRDHLVNLKVLLVLDDVDNISQLENLAEEQEWFGRGSRIMITTRDKGVLRSLRVVKYYKIDLLNYDESLQLFCQKAFQRNQPQEHQSPLSKFAIQQAGGLPLALQMLGSFFRGRSEFERKEFLDRKEYPNKDIVMKKLKISYDGLPPIYQTLFLYIACFFKGWVKERVKQIVTSCDPNLSETIIEVLVERSLVTCDGLRLGMHDLLEEMGRKIVVGKHPIDAGKRRMLWSLEDIDQVLKRNKENDSIVGIVLKSSTQPYQGNWDPKAFSKMYNLKFLIINCHNIQLSGGLECLCSSLKFLQWKEYPLEAMPLGVQLDELVELKMRYSKIKKIWSESQSFAKLKFIDLSHSIDLIQTPIVSGVPCLEILLLEGCINLVKVDESVGQHKKLALLNLKDCINLKTFPRKLEMDSLEELILSGCSKVKKLPVFGQSMICLSLLVLENCKNLLSLPDSICNLKSLKKLNICGCSKLSTLPHNMNENESLEEIDLSGTAISEFSSSKVCLENLHDLSLGGRKQLASKSSRNLHQWISMFRKQPVMKELILPPFSSLCNLKFLDLSYCDLKDDSIPNGLGSLSSLVALDLSGNNFVSPPAHCISNLSMLQSLTLTDCPTLESLPMLPPNVQCLCTLYSTQEKPVSSDAYMLWKIFESHMNQAYFLYTPHSPQPQPVAPPNYFHQVFVNQVEDKPHVWFIIPGKYISKWNKETFSIDPSHQHYDKLGSDSAVSVIVDVPNYCQSSEWWGIAICLALEPLNVQPSSPSHVRPSSMGNEETCIYYWASKASNVEPGLSFPIEPDFGHLVYECSEEKCQLQLNFFVENLSKPLKPRIRKGGCSVMSKKNVEDWCKLSKLTEVNTNNQFSDELKVE